MNDEKKPQPPSNNPKQLNESHDFSEAALSNQLNRRQNEVTNTRPAPPNPNRDDSSSNQDG